VSDAPVPNERSWARAWALVAAGLLAATITACAPRNGATVAAVPVAGGNSPPMPPLPAAEAHIDPTALTAAGLLAERDGATALLVARNGHIVYERYWHGTTFRSPIEAGAWQGVIDDLLAGALADDRKPLHADSTPGRAQIAAAAGVAYESYLSKRLWRPLGAYDATLAPDLRAAQGDWIRLGELLANDGVYLGEELVRPGWVARVLARHRCAAEDAAPGLAPDLCRLPGANAASLWVAPSLRLVILRTGGAPGPTRDATDARMVDAILRGLTDRPGARPPGEGLPDPATLVPAH